MGVGKSTAMGKTRLDYFKERTDRHDDDVYHQADVRTLQTLMPELEGLSLSDIDTLYGDWCTCEYAAGWLSWDIGTSMHGFRKWVMSKPWSGPNEMYPPDWYPKDNAR